MEDDTHNTNLGIIVFMLSILQIGQKLSLEADKVFDEKGYDANTIEQWRKEHNR